jgi:hypothetical protein
MIRIKKVLKLQQEAVLAKTRRIKWTLHLG